MSDPIDTTDAVQSFLLAYERLDAAWRVQLDLDANEKVVLLFLVEHTATTQNSLEHTIDLDSIKLDPILDRLERDAFVRRDAGEGLVWLTKRGLGARVMFEGTYATLADQVPDTDADAVVDFLRRAAAALATEAEMIEQENAPA